MLNWGLEWQSLDSYFQFQELASSPSTPEPGHLRIYAKDKSSTSAFYLLDDAGSEREIAPANIVTGTGTANRLAYWTSSSVIGALAALTQGHVLFADANGLPTGESNLFWNATDDRLGIGTATPEQALHISGAVASSLHRRATGDAGGSIVFMQKGRGSISSPAATQAADSLGALTFGGYDGSAWQTNSAIIQGLADSLWSGSNRASRVIFATTPTGSTTVAERFRVGPAGQWGIGGANFGTAGQYKRSGGASAPPTWATIDHGSELAGLTDDDHTQYALLAGRSGGQTLIGGTAAADDLTLRATAGVGAGSEAIILQVGSNGALEALRAGQANSQSVISVGTSVLDITNASTLEPRFIVSGAGTAHNAQIIRHTTVGGGGATFTLSGTRGAGANTHTSGALQAADGIGQLEFSGSDGTRFITAALIRAVVETTFTTDTPPSYLSLMTNSGSSPSSPVETARLTANGNTIVGRGAMFLAALAQDATNGFLYIPTCAGEPNGTPTSYTGKVAMVFDTTNDRLCVYDGGWLFETFTNPA